MDPLAINGAAAAALPGFMVTTTATMCPDGGLPGALPAVPAVMPAIAPAGVVAGGLAPFAMVNAAVAAGTPGVFAPPASTAALDCAWSNMAGMAPGFAAAPAPGIPAGAFTPVAGTPATGATGAALAADATSAALDVGTKQSGVLGLDPAASPNPHLLGAFGTMAADLGVSAAPAASTAAPPPVNGAPPLSGELLAPSAVPGPGPGAGAYGPPALRPTLPALDSASAALPSSLPQIDSSKLYLGGLPQQADENTVHAFFSPFANVLSVEIKRDKFTGNSRGFGFVEFESAIAARGVLAMGREHVIAGKIVEVKQAEDRRGSEFLRDMREGGGPLIRPPSWYFSGAPRPCLGMGKSGQLRPKGAASLWCEPLGPYGAKSAKPAKGGKRDRDRDRDFSLMAGPWKSLGLTFGKPDAFHPAGGYSGPPSIFGEKGKGKGKNKIGKSREEGTVFVKGLPPLITEGEIKDYFCLFSPVKNVDIKYDLATGTPRGHAFVTFEDPLAAKVIQESSEAHIIGGAQVTINLAFGAGGIDSPEARKIFVGGIPRQVTEEEVNLHFSHFGLVEEVLLKRDPAGESRGFGFVTFADMGGMTNAMLNYDNNQIHGKWVDVRPAEGGWEGCVAQASLGSTAVVSSLGSVAPPGLADGGAATWGGGPDPLAPLGSIAGVAPPLGGGEGAQLAALAPTGGMLGLEALSAAAASTALAALGSTSPAGMEFPGGVLGVPAAGSLGPALQQPTHTSEERKIFVGGLSWETSEEDLRQHFGRFGAVVEVLLKKGFAFVTFADVSAVPFALAMCGSHIVRGKGVEVRQAGGWKGRSKGPGGCGLAPLLPTVLPVVPY